MAFVSSSAATAVAANVRGRGPKFDGYALEIQPYAKAGGDTTGTVTPAVLKRIIACYVINSDGTAIAAGVTITNGTSPSVALTSLGGGTSGIVLLKGAKR